MNVTLISQGTWSEAHVFNTQASIIHLSGKERGRKGKFTLLMC